MTEAMISGKCLCEGVQYQITGTLGPIFNCHCSKCRRWHGAAFRTRASIKVEQFKLVNGAELVAVYESSDNVTKHFCRNCGSPLHSTYKDRPDVIGVAVGPLEGNLDGPKANIFVDSKAPWYEINDSLPCHSGWPVSESEVRKTNG